MPAAAVLPTPPRVARDLHGPTVVVCNAGSPPRTGRAGAHRRGADATVLTGGMRGWIGLLRAVPVEVDVPGLEVRQIQRPGRGCLSYIVAAGDRALVVDPAPDADVYLALADDLGVSDHRRRRHPPARRSPLRRPRARPPRRRAPATCRPPRSIAASRTRVRSCRSSTATRSTSAASPIRAIALPGHTTDMTGLLVGERALIGGDSLFVDGIARPDLQQGDPEGARAMARMLHRTLHERVLTLGDDVVLLPGHTHPGLHGTAIAGTLGEIRRAVPELAIDDPSTFAEELLADMPPRPANYEAVIAVNAGQHPYDPDLEAGGNSCSTR